MIIPCKQSTSNFQKVERSWERREKEARFGVSQGKLQQYHGQTINMISRASQDGGVGRVWIWKS